MRLGFRFLFVLMPTLTAYCQTSGYWALIEKKTYYFDGGVHHSGCYTGSGKGDEGNFVTTHTATATCFRENRNLTSEMQWSSPPGVLLPREVIPFKMTHRVVENGVGSTAGLTNTFTARIDVASMPPDRVGGLPIRLGDIGVHSDRHPAGYKASVVNEEATEPQRMWGKASYDVVLRVAVSNWHSWVWDAIYMMT